MPEPKPHQPQEEPVTEDSGLTYEYLEGDAGAAHDEAPHIKEYKRRPEDAEELSDEEYARRYDYALDALTNDRNEDLLHIQWQYAKTLLSRDIDPSSVSVWEAQRLQNAAKAMKEVNSVLDSDWAKEITAKSPEERDAFDDAVVSVMLDSRMTLDRNVVKAGPDVADLSVGTAVMRARHEFEGEEPSEEFLQKSEQTVRLLTAVGVYKFEKWGNSNQLQTAGKLLEAYARDVPGFEIYENGAHLARTYIDRATAAIRLDLQSKPNFQYARPELYSYMRGAEATAESVLAAEAYHLVDTYDFKVPKDYVSSTEAQANEVMAEEAQQAEPAAAAEEPIEEPQAEALSVTEQERRRAAYAGHISVTGSFF